MSFSSFGASGEPTGIIKIIGIGQSMRGDDGAGLAAVRLWIELFQNETARPNVRAELAELPGIGLLNVLEGVRFAILVDAVRSGAKPGTIHQLSGDQLEAFTVGSSSAHGWGVAETLSLGKKLLPASIPGKLILVGIEAGDISLGEALSPEVRQALPEAALLIEQLVSQGSSVDQDSSTIPRISPK